MFYPSTLSISMFYLRITAILITIVLGLSACDSSNTSNQTAAITTQPTDQSVVVGTAATFTVVASNATGYQWQSSTDSGATFVDVSGANIASYSTAVTTLGDSGTQYRVVVSGASNSVTSSAVTLTVTTAPVAPGISVQPTDQTITEGNNTSFSVTATGTSLNYQWQLSTNSGINFSDMSGETGATLNLTAVQLVNNANQYRVVITNNADSVTSNAALLTVNQAPSAPAFTADPASLSVVAPDTATFTATVTGFPTPTLQWQLDAGGGGNFVDITGATSSSYTTPATGIGDDGNLYRVVASSTSGNIASASAVLSVALPAAPGFTTQPADVTIVEGQNAQFTVVVTGTPTPTLQWQVSTNSGSTWGNINGETGTTFTAVAPALANNGRQFRVVATNNSGSLNSNAATLTVTAAPTVSGWQPAVRVSPDTDGDVYSYQLAYSANGDAMAVWTMYTNLQGGGVRMVVWANHYSPNTGWETATPVSDDTVDAGYPQIGMDASGNAIAVWEQSNGAFYARNDIWFNRYVAGNGWGSAALLETSDVASTGSQQIAVAASGHAIATWTQRNANNTGSETVARSYVPNSGWGAPAPLATGTDTSVNVGGFLYNTNPGAAKVAIDASGNTVAVWPQFTGTQIDLFASHNSGAPVQIATAGAGGNPNDIQVASNASGETVAAWGLGCVSWANRYVPGTGWGTAAALQSGNPGCSVSPKPQVAVDNSGNAIVAWVNGTTAYINRYSAGSGWLGASPINYSGLHFQFAMNATGQTLSAWQSSTLLAGNDTFVTGYNFSGSVQIFGGTGLDATGLKIAMDASGNTIVLFKRAEITGRNTIWSSVYK